MSAYKEYCYLYSSIDSSCTSCTSFTGCSTCTTCASCTNCNGGYCTDTGRISGDVSCPGAQALIACCRNNLPCCTRGDRADTSDVVSRNRVKENALLFYLLNEEIHNMKI